MDAKYTTDKIMFNSVISTPNAKFMTGDLKRKLSKPLATYYSGQG